MTDLKICLNLRNEGLHKGITPDYRINNFPLSSIGSSISNELICLFNSSGGKYLYLDALGCLCSYIIIPYGKEGISYVEKKIFPEKLDDFLKKKIDILLEKTDLTEEEYLPFKMLAYRYCEDYIKDILPFNNVSMTIFLARYYSEMLKTGHYGYNAKRTKEDNKLFLEYQHFSFSYINSMKELDGKEIKISKHIEEMLKNFPFEINFVFGDEQRKEIDGMMMFTQLTK